jgi:aconitate hydratase
VLSGNRNFEGRVNPDVRANYLASPPLVVAYALAGSMNVDITKDAIGYDDENEPVYLADIWPTSQEIAQTVRTVVTAEMFATRYSDVFKGDVQWQAIKVEGGATYGWPMASTYVQNPPYFEGMTMTPEPVTDVANAKSSRCSAIRSPPTTSRPPATSRPRALPASTCANTRCR